MSWYIFSIAVFLFAATYVIDAIIKSNSFRAELDLANSDDQLERKTNAVIEKLQSKGRFATANRLLAFKRRSFPLGGRGRFENFYEFSARMRTLLERAESRHPRLVESLKQKYF